MRPDVHFHIRAGARGADRAIGPGKVALLEAIAETGSITAAAKRLGMSYRRAWLLIEETDRCLVGGAVETAAGGSRGGGTRLTTSGTALVKRYRALEREIAAAAARELRSLLRTGRNRE